MLYTVTRRVLIFIAPISRVTGRFNFSLTASAWIRSGLLFGAVILTGCCSLYSNPLTLRFTPAYNRRVLDSACR